LYVIPLIQNPDYRADGCAWGKGGKACFSTSDRRVQFSFHIVEIS